MTFPTKLGCSRFLSVRPIMVDVDCHQTGKLITLQPAFAVLRSIKSNKHCGGNKLAVGPENAGTED